MGKGKNNKNSVKKTKKKVLKKFLLSTFSLEELLAKAQEEIDVFNFKEAQLYCQEALKRDPDHLRALEVSASLCIETENLDGAKRCLGRAITLAPENGFSKYLSMGQLLEGRDSLQCYLKGVELLNNAIKEQAKNEQAKSKESSKQNGIENSTDIEMDDGEEKPLTLNDESSVLVRKLSNAYCAIGELFMSDLCDEEEAEIESLAYIQKAIHADSSNPEAYQHHANYLLIKEKLEEAKESIKKSVSLWLPKYQEVDDGEACAGSFDPVEVCPISQSARYGTAQILIEVEEHQLAADVLESLLGENDEAVYTWYLLGWNHYLQGKEHQLEAKQHFIKALEIHKTVPTRDEGILEHMNELMEELKEIEDDTEEEISDNDDDIEELEREIDEMDVS